MKKAKFIKTKKQISLKVFNLNFDEVIWVNGNKLVRDKIEHNGVASIVPILDKKFVIEVLGNIIKIIIHPRSIVHALVIFNNGIIKVLMHDTSMEIPLFNIIFNKSNISFYNLN